MMSKPVNVLALVFGALGLGILWDVLFNGHLPGISVPIYLFVFLGLTLTFRAIHARHVSAYTWCVSVAMMGLSLFYAFRTSELLAVLNTMALLYLGALLYADLFGAHIWKFNTEDFFLFPVTDTLIGFLTGLRIFKLLKPSNMNGKTRAVRAIIAGVLVAIVFGTLLISSDEVLKSIVSDLFSPEFLRRAFGHLFLMLFIGGTTVGLFGAAFWQHPKVREVVTRTRNFGVALETFVGLIVANVMFIAFLIFQSVYFFGGERNLERFGLTYAEYARHGFFQLLTVALLVALVMWFAGKLHEGKWTPANKGLQVVLAVQTGAILLSSWLRLGYYEQAFGFTYLRLGSHYSLVVVAVILLILVVALFVKVARNHLLHLFLATLVIALLGFNLLNPDAFITRNNLARSTDVVALDLDYLYEFGDDAFVVRAKALDYEGRYPDYEEFTDLDRELESMRAQRRELNSRIVQAPANDPVRIELVTERNELDVQIEMRESTIDRTAELSNNLMVDDVEQGRDDLKWPSWNWARARANRLRSELRSE